MKGDYSLERRIKRGDIIGVPRTIEELKIMTERPPVVIDPIQNLDYFV